MRCSFCSHEFSEEEGAKACSQCALFGGCRSIKCPRCGYETPQTPSLLKSLKSALTAMGSRKSKTEDPKSRMEGSGLPLTRLCKQQEAVVVSLASAPKLQRSKLAALGVLPGAPLVLVQRQPSFVIQVGNTQIALDRETAIHILVRTAAA